MPPVQAKSYRSQKKLSEGGMGEVFLALTSNPLRKFLVLKKLKMDIADATAREQFVHEAQITTELRHPNIVKVYECVENGGELHIEMEWLQGRSLRQVLDGLHGQPVPPRVAGAIVHGVCRALDCAWRAPGTDNRPLEIIHRDITPNNVMVTFEGGVKVIDFGLAKASNTGAWTAEVKRGTPEYLSPERAEELLRYVDPRADAGVVPPLDGRSDLFCAGLLLYELLTGRTLFRAQPPPGLLSGVELQAWQGAILGRIARCSEPLEGLPAELEPIVRKALARDRAERYGTAGEMADALREALGLGEAPPSELKDFLRGVFPTGLDESKALEAELEAAAAPTPEPVPPPTPSPPPRRFLSRGMALVVAVLIAVCAGWALWPKPRPSPAQSTVSVVRADTLVGSHVKVIVGVKDARGRPMTELPVQLRVVGASGGLNPPAQALTDGEGTAQLEFSWDTPEQVALSAVVEPGPGQVVLDGSPLVFTAGLPDAGNSSFTQVPEKVVAGQPASFQVTLRDEHGHATGGKVSFTVTAPGGPPPELYEVEADARGLAVLAYRTQVAGPRRVEAAVVTVNGRQPLKPVEVLVEAGPPHASSTLTVHVEPGPDGREAPPVADGQEPVELRVEVRDAYGNPVQGSRVRFEVSETEGYTLESPEPTDARGLARGILRATRTKPVHIRALLTEGPQPVELWTEVTFAPGAPSLANSTLAAKPAKVILGGKNHAVLTATVRDAHDNPIPDLEVRFEAQGPGSRVQPKETVSNEEGRASVELGSTQVGRKSVAASIRRHGEPKELFRLKEDVHFEARAPGADKSSLSASPEVATADGQASITVTAVVKDAHDKPVQGRYVLLSSSDAESRFDRRMGPTDARGVASEKLTATRSEDLTFTASIEPLSPDEAATPIGNQVTVRFRSNPPDAGKSRLSSSASTLTAGESASLQFAVLDARGLAIPGAKVTWKALDSKAQFQKPTFVTDGQGLASATVPLTSAGMTHLAATAEVDGTTLTKDLYLNVQSGPLHTVNLSSGDVVVLPDGHAFVKLTLGAKDRYGNPVANQEVVWQGLEPDDALEPAATTTQAPGPVSATLTMKKAGPRTVKAVVGHDKPLSAECTVNFQEPAPTKEMATPPALAGPQDGGDAGTGLAAQKDSAAPASAASEKAAPESKPEEKTSSLPSPTQAEDAGTLGQGAAPPTRALAATPTEAAPAGDPQAAGPTDAGMPLAHSDDSVK